VHIGRYDSIKNKNDSPLEPMEDIGRGGQETIIETICLKTQTNPNINLF